MQHPTSTALLSRFKFCCHTLGSASSRSTASRAPSALAPRPALSPPPAHSRAGVLVTSKHAKSCEIARDRARSSGAALALRRLQLGAAAHHLLVLLSSPSVVAGAPRAHLLHVARVLLPAHVRAASLLPVHTRRCARRAAASARPCWPSAAAATPLTSSATSVAATRRPTRCSNTRGCCREVDRPTDRPGRSVQFV